VYGHVLGAEDNNIVVSVARALCNGDGDDVTLTARRRRGCRLMRSWYNRGVCRARWHPVSGDDDSGGGRPDGRTSCPSAARHAAVRLHRTGPSMTRPDIAVFTVVILKSKTVLVMVPG